MKDIVNGYEEAMSLLLHMHRQLHIDYSPFVHIASRLLDRAVKVTG